MLLMLLKHPIELSSFPAQMNVIYRSLVVPVTKMKRNEICVLPLDGAHDSAE